MSGIDKVLSPLSSGKERPSPKLFVWVASVLLVAKELSYERVVLTDLEHQTFQSDVAKFQALWWRRKQCEFDPRSVS